MIQLVRSYLLQHKSVSLPGLGTIYIERTPAQSDFVNHQILPPAYHYRFDRYFDTPDKNFFSFLSAKKNIQDFEAIKLFNEWALDIRNKISGTGDAVSLEGIGSLNRDGSGNIVFEPAGKPVTYDTVIAAERIVRTNAQHTMLVGDKETTNTEMTDYLSGETHKEKISWWVYAVIIAAIALIIIFFAYRNSGASPFGTQQKIETR